MTPLVNPISAVVALLRSDPDIADAVGNVRLYGETVPFILGGEITGDAKDLMLDVVTGDQPGCILVTEAGAARRPMSAPVITPRVDIRCYSKTIEEASELGLVVHDKLQYRPTTRGREARRRLRNVVIQSKTGTGFNRAAILSATLVGGPTPGREPSPDRWTFNLRTYNFLMLEELQPEN